MIPEHLTKNPFPDTNWPPEMKPLVVLDGVAHSIKDLDTRITGDVAYFVGVNQQSFDRVLNLISAKTMQFYEMRVADISSLVKHPGIVELAINWNTKIEDLSPLKQLRKLKHLVLVDTPKIVDLSVLEKCKSLEILEYSGGIWNKNKAISLNPISNLTSLTKLRLLNLKIENGGLKPLASLTNLEKLEVSNQFPTEDYAYLSVHLNKTECSHFVPYIKLEHPINGKDAMVVGSRKPFLNMKENSDILSKYEEKFKYLQQKYSADGHTRGDTEQA